MRRCLQELNEDHEMYEVMSCGGYRRISNNMGYQQDCIM